MDHSGSRRDDPRVRDDGDPGRYLLVVIAPALEGGVYVVIARDLTDSERRTFRRKGR
jgi:hypothetical protein